MRDALYIHVRKRVERRLSGSPRAATLNALGFTLLAGPLALLSLVLRVSDGIPFGSIDGVVYWVSFLWSIVLLAHVTRVYWHSSARAAWREKQIEGEVFDVGELDHLDSEDMIDLHERLSDDLQRSAGVYHRLLLNAGLNFLLWPGLLLGMWLAQGLMSPWLSSAGLLFSQLLPFAVIGTMLLGLALPVRRVFFGSRRDRDDLRAIYGGKRKRGEKFKHAAVRLSDDGELVSDDEFDDGYAPRVRSDYGA
jgi:hypothetical protein